MAQIIGQLEDGFFTPDQPDALNDLLNVIRHNDRFYVCADYEDYVKKQEEASKLYMDQDAWNRKVNLKLIVLILCLILGIVQHRFIWQVLH